MHRYSRIVEELIEAVMVPLYGAAGVVGDGGLVVSGMVAGRRRLYLYRGGVLRDLGVEPFNVAVHRYGSGWVAYTVDLGAGREEEAVYILDPESGDGPRRVEGVPAGRVLGLVSLGEGGVVAVVSTSEDVAVYASRGAGEAAGRAARLPGPGLLLDSDGRVAAGVMLDGFQLFVADLASGKVSVYKSKGIVTAAAVGFDGYVYYAVSEPGGARVYRLPGGGGEAEEVHVPGLREYGATWVDWLGATPDGELLVAASRGTSGRLFSSRLGDTGFPGDGGVVYNAFRVGGRLLATYSSIRDPTGVYEAPSGSVVAAGEPPWWAGEAVERVYEAYPEAPDGSAVPTVVVESRRTGRPGPTVVLVHGGPFSAYRDEWSAGVLVLAAMGFHVVMPNYRGSTGFGPGWMTGILGDPCGAELEDVMAAAEWARRDGLASRLYIAGYSYGGYMTLCALTRRPGVFRAGFAGAPVTDWLELKRLGDATMRAFVDILFAGKGEEAMRERSPITWIEGLREPVCISASTNDTRTPLPPVLEFVRRAAELGKSVEAHIAPGMGHVINTAEDALKALMPCYLFLARMESGG